jgi:opacity protein-like surface antigen
VTINDRICYVFRTITALAVASTALTGVATAQQAGQTTTTIPPEMWTATPFVGFAFSGDLDSATGAIGIAGGYVWSPRLSFEGELNFLPSSENSGLVEVNTSVVSFTANALYHFSGRRWVPYGVGGIGFGHAKADVSPNDPVLATFDDTSNSFVAAIGGGVEHALRNNTAVRGDFRYMFGGDLVPDYWRLTAGVVLGFAGP